MSAWEAWYRNFCQRCAAIAAYVRAEGIPLGGSGKKPGDGTVKDASVVFYLAFFVAHEMSDSPEYVWR
jgi:hypothetical protein